jgi:prepilin-type N-terminal cleavage/methylation domain-containing protein
MARAFTLVELLVATSIFVIGFTAALAMFTKGVRDLQTADSLTRASLAATSLMDEFRLDAGMDGFDNGRDPFPPSAYVGDGFAGNGAATAEIGRLYPYRAMPGIWYTVRRSTSLLNDPNDKLTTTLHFDLVVMPLAVDEASAGSTTAQPGFSLTEAWFRRRMSIALGATAEPILDNLVERGLAFRFQGALVRRPSWLPLR